MFGRLFTCSSTTVLACCIAADALDQTFPHPQDAVLGFSSAVLDEVSVLGLESAVAARDALDPDPRREGVPTRTRSVLFLTVGVPEREFGRSAKEEVGFVGSELFCVISSMNASASAASAVGAACWPDLLGAPPGLAVPVAASDSESRESKNWRASSFRDFAFDIIASSRVVVGGGREGSEKVGVRPKSGWPLKAPEVIQVASSEFNWNFVVPE